MTTEIASVWRRLRYTRLRDVVRGQLDASLDWRGVISRANLPAEIEGAIGRVVRGTRLWRREKVEVAFELVAHFQDGLEAGRSPDELVKSFGDLRQTGRLIRRAKKRGRSLVWHLSRYACWTVVAIVLVYLAAGLWMLAGKPNVATDYLALINERAAAVPEDQRAWPLYREALLALGINLSNPDADQAVVLEAKPGDAFWPKTEQFLRDHAASVITLRAAASRPELGLPATTLPAGVSPIDREILGAKVTPEQVESAKHPTVQHQWLISTLLPDVQLLRSAATVLARDALRAAMAGDGDTALADVVALFGIGRHSEEKPFFVSVLSGVAIQKQAYATIQRILTERPDLWTDGQLRDLAHTISAARIDWKRGFVGERASFYDIMQRFYTDDGNGDGRLVLQVSDDQNVFEVLGSGFPRSATTPFSSALSQGASAALMLPAANLLVASRKEMTDVYDRLFSRAMEQFDAPLWEETTSPLEEELLAAMETPLGMYRYSLVRALLPSYEGLRNAVAAFNGARDGVLIGIALELYHREHGKWPAALAELSPRWLPELPVDRITGTSLELKIVNDRPVIYSVGVDGKDDGGQLPADCEGDATRYRVSAPYEWKHPDATQQMRNQYYGDWVIWSVAPQERRVREIE